MLWLEITILAYILFAISSLIDRYLLAGPLPRPGVYAFGVGFGGLLFVLLMPFGFQIPAPSQIGLSLLTGGVWILALFFMYKAVEEGEISRVAPLIGALVPVFTFLLTLFLGQANFSLSYIFLIGGSLLLSRGSRKKLIPAVLSALLFAVGFLLMKTVYSSQSFISGFIWMRLGGVLVASMFLLSSRVREGLRQKETREGNTIFFVILAQVLGGVAFVLQNYAVSLVDLSRLPLINALEGIRYLLVIVFAFILGRFVPSLLKEKVSFGSVKRRVVAAILIIIGLALLAVPAPDNEVEWGVNFSAKHASLMGLDARETYTAVLDDLGAERIKLATYWNELEPSRGEYDFQEMDWMMREAKKRDVDILLVVGMKTPRWPECHIPGWAGDLSPEEKEDRVNLLVEKVVRRYDDSVWGFQIENEPFLDFGECPDRPKGFVKREVRTARSITDKTIVISDSGEWSLWGRVAKIGDMVATTIYRRVWFKELNRYTTYPIPPSFYRFKAWIVERVFNTKVICGELQAEPWGPVLLYDLPLEEQKKTMSFDQFKRVIEYARQTDLGEHYLWGTEWWYWLKEQGRPEFWNEVRSLLKS